MIDIVLLSHNDLWKTMHCVDCLYKNTQETFRLIVIDDSTDLTPKFFKQLGKEHDNIKYIHPKFSITSANQAVNYAVRFVKSEFFVLMANSTFVEPDWLTIAVRLMNQFPDIGIIGFKILMWPRGKILEAGSIMDTESISAMHVGEGEYSHRYTHIRETAIVGWSLVLLRKKAMFKLDENTYHGFRGIEDQDNCLEFKKRGWRVIYNGTGVAYHILGSSLGIQDVQQRKEVVENTVRFSDKWRGKVPA